MTLGIVIVLFVALVGLGTLGTAIRFAIRPTEQGLAVLRPLSAATTSATLAASFHGFATALLNVIHGLEEATDAAATAKAWQVFLAGLAEATVPLISASRCWRWPGCWSRSACGSRRDPGRPDRSHSRCVRNSSISWNRWMRSG